MSRPPASAAVRDAGTEPRDDGRSPRSDPRAAIAAGRTALGIELGSTRIKAVLIGPDHAPLASGSHDWENQFVDRVWTYSLDAVWTGLQECVAALLADVEQRYGVRPTTFGALGVSAMMHGYLAFDDAGELLVPFRTWRNTTTGPRRRRAHASCSGTTSRCAGRSRTCYQAILDDEPHVPQRRASSPRSPATCTGG